MASWGAALIVGALLAALAYVMRSAARSGHRAQRDVELDTSLAAEPDTGRTPFGRPLPGTGSPATPAVPPNEPLPPDAPPTPTAGPRPMPRQRDQAAPPRPEGPPSTER